MATGVDAKLLKTTKFPPEFNQKVDMTKVNLQVMKKYVQTCFQSSVQPLQPYPSSTTRPEADLTSPRWIAGKVTEILGTEDDVVIELIFNLIEGPRYVSSPSSLRLSGSTHD
jgi:serine/arginine repetitive matrix protein 1